MTSSVETFIASQLNALYAGVELGNYALECADVEELRNYPAVDGALPAYHRSLGEGFVIFEGSVGGSHVVVFQAKNIDRDRAGRCNRFLGKHGVEGYVSETLAAVCDAIGDTDVCERAIDSYVYIDGNNWYAANPEAIVVDRPATDNPVVAVPVLERKRQRSAQRAIDTLTQERENVKDDFCPEWMMGELAEAWSDYETFGDL